MWINNFLSSCSDKSQMRFCRLSFVSISAACIAPLFLVDSNIAYPSAPSRPFDLLPDELLSIAQQYLPTDLGLLGASTRIRQAVLLDAMLPLNRRYSFLYINNEKGFRDEANGRRANLRKRVRLNLGQEFREYMLNAELRTTVDALVDSPLHQIWSDMETLELAYSEVQDIRPLAALVNLRHLRLTGARVRDISALAGLVNLEDLFLTATEVDDISALAGLVNLEHLHLSSTPVNDIVPSLD